MTHKCY